MHLHFGQIPSFIENVQYHTLQTVKHNFEEDKKMLQSIPWNQVPIPKPQVNVKILGKGLNQQKKERKRFMKMEMECKQSDCECDDAKPKDDPMNPKYDEILGGTYIGNNATSSEPVLTEFAKKAIEVKMQIHDEMEKPKEGASWKEIAKADNKYIQNCKIAMKELRENWKGDENQSQESAPIAPKDIAAASRA